MSKLKIILVDSIRKAQIPSLCHLCEDSPSIQWKCVDCKLLMCSKCKIKVHSKFKDADDHDVISLKDVSFETEQKQKINYQNIACKLHKGQKICLYCNGCRKMVCPNCITEEHKKHDLEDLRKMYEERSRRLECFRDELRADLIFVQEIETEQSTVHEITKQDIMKQKDTLIKAVEEEATEILNILENSNIQPDQTVTDFKVETKSQISTVEAVLNSNDIRAILNADDELIPVLSNRRKTNKDAGNRVLIFYPGRIDQKQVSKMLGYLGSSEDDQEMQYMKRRPPPPLPARNWKPPEIFDDDHSRTKETFSIRRSQLELEELGSGQLGSVQKGYCTLKREGRIPVAVKKLKIDDKYSEEEIGKKKQIQGMTEALLSEDIINEPLVLLRKHFFHKILMAADLMRNLNHQRILRLIGLCRADCIMFVVELCPFGPLNSYLSKHKQTKQSVVIQLMWQVAQGMSYLHSKKYVHRNLAARNVLLVSESLAKISDFEMCRALNSDGYYKAQEAGKWPLRWYPPECIYYWRFNTNSDVWSYGVTLWEATSLGLKPYKNMKGNEIMKFLVEENQRLAKPEYSDEQVYQIMLQCWAYEEKDRPSFKEIEQKIQHHYQRLVTMGK